jgi:hypothetical protein
MTIVELRSREKCSILRILLCSFLLLHLLLLLLLSLYLSVPTVTASPSPSHPGESDSNSDPRRRHAAVGDVQSDTPFAYVTLLTTFDYGYILGLEVVAKMLQSFSLPVKNTHSFICLVVEDVRQHTSFRELERRLHGAGYELRFVPAIENPRDNTERDWFLSTYSKLHVS